MVVEVDSDKQSRPIKSISLTAVMWSKRLNYFAEAILEKDFTILQEYQRLLRQQMTVVSLCVTSDLLKEHIAEIASSISLIFSRASLRLSDLAFPPVDVSVNLEWCSTG